MCKKINKISMCDVGIIYKQQCQKPEYKDGLCKYHYNKQQSKLVNWGDRVNYRSATQEDLDCQKSLKLKNTRVHHIFQCRSKIIYKFNPKNNNYEITNILPDFNLFCVKTN